MELVDIGFNFTSSAFRKDADEVVARAKHAGVKNFVLTGSDIEESKFAIELLLLVCIHISPNNGKMIVTLN